MHFSIARLPGSLFLSINIPKCLSTAILSCSVHTIFAVLAVVLSVAFLLFVAELLASSPNDKNIKNGLIKHPYYSDKTNVLIENPQHSLWMIQNLNQTSEDKSEKETYEEDKGAKEGPTEDDGDQNDRNKCDASCPTKSKSNREQRKITSLFVPSTSEASTIQ